MTVKLINDIGCVIAEEEVQGEDQIPFVLKSWIIYEDDKIVVEE